MSFVLAALLSLPARADVGPPPCCEEGTHREYCEGNQCVPNGYELDSGCEEVEDPDPPDSYDDDECNSCGCSSGAAGASAGALGLLLALALSRRR